MARRSRDGGREPWGEFTNRLRADNIRPYIRLYAGGKLIRQTDGTNPLDFFYGENGHPYALKYNGTTYYYVTNLQGDVLHIVDSNKQVVASYTYDPYGKVLTATGSMASTLGADNPLRYRGYVFDSETGFYYLQSRYYDPTTCRFINADSYASTGQGILGCNMFAYCLSNPICYIDTIGQFSVTFYGDNDNELFSSDDLGFGGDSGESPWDEFMVYLDSAFRGLEMAMGNHPDTTQNHHMFSNKHSKFTPQYKEIFELHNAKLTQRENIIELTGHRGRHTNAYHTGMLDVLHKLANIAKGDYEMFIIGLRKIGKYMQENTGLPYAK